MKQGSHTYVVHTALEDLSIFKRVKFNLIQKFKAVDQNHRNYHFGE